MNILDKNYDVYNIFLFIIINKLFLNVFIKINI